jgi:5'(3')-deoxyribonucleotidase
MSKSETPKERKWKMKQTYYFDMDGVLANFHKEPYNPYHAMSREWIANLEPFTNAIETVKKLIANGNRVYISSLAASENAKQGKLEWLAKYLPEIKKSRVIIIVGNGKKAEYMKTKTGILVDDKLANCKQWTKISGQPAIWVEEKGQVLI